MRRHVHNSLLPYKAILSLSHSLSLSYLPLSGGRDELFQLCVTKTKLGTWQFQYGPFLCIKLIGSGFGEEVMWLHASHVFVKACAVINNCFRISEKHTPSTSCKILKKNDQPTMEWNVLKTKSKKKRSSILITESKHCCAHSIKAGFTKTQQQAAIDPSTAAVRAQWDSTLIDYFVINSSWLPAGETSRRVCCCSATALVHSVSHSDHKRYICNQLLLASWPFIDTNTHTHT